MQWNDRPCENIQLMLVDGVWSSHQCFRTRMAMAIPLQLTHLRTVLKPSNYFIQEKPMNNDWNSSFYPIHEPAILSNEVLHCFTDFLR
ncbi:Uncharacterized protein TCM_020822 [Theobroma cacao]|uniref:Uncharacterized protein n=1 Tax=Theobroma cacao TaxID=3641 RepID=A0A061ELN3_THECC|nr:Uncharacterized protein TCM_020822 [Theobroma cacao]